MSKPMQVGDGIIYHVRAGNSLQQISADIHNKKLSPLPIQYLALYGRLTNKDHLIKAGEYYILPETTLPEFLEQIINGAVMQHSFTIVEGMTTQELIALVASDNRLITALNSTDTAAVMAAINQADRHGEGEFLPETYYFTAGTTDVELLKRAHQAMTTYLHKMWSNRAGHLPYKTAYDALIMASIIEKETGVAEERSKIAGVFVRRLQKGMKLQADPSVIYGLGSQFDGNLRRKDLRQDTPYNTYVRHGLPPTPIALPGKASIAAALHPDRSDNLYFVATGEGGRHLFSSTLSAHNQAVSKYQLKNNAR